MWGFYLIKGVCVLLTRMMGLMEGGLCLLYMFGHKVMTGI